MQRTKRTTKATASAAAATTTKQAEPKPKAEPLPTCPICGGTMVPIRRERSSWDKWARRWWCRRCARETVTPDKTTE